MNQKDRLKFKAKTKKGEWIVFNILECPDNIFPETIRQFTGFKDKDGKEIYEGDILSDFTETDEGLHQSNLQVFWNNERGSWHLDNSSKQDKTYSEDLWFELSDFDFKINGNIFDGYNEAD